MAYIVKRSISDNGPMGDTYAYVKVSKPHPGETIYHGRFEPRTVYGGQYDAESKTVYDPVGKITSETYEGGGEVF